MKDSISKLGKYRSGHSTNGTRQCAQKSVWFCQHHLKRPWCTHMLMRSSEVRWTAKRPREARGELTATDSRKLCSIPVSWKQTFAWELFSWKRLSCLTVAEIGACDWADALDVVRSKATIQFSAALAPASTRQIPCICLLPCPGVEPVGVHIQHPIGGSIGKGSAGDVSDKKINHSTYTNFSQRQAWIRLQGVYPNNQLQWNEWSSSIEFETQRG